MQMFSLHVDRAHRRKGIGRSLFEAVERRAKTDGAKRLDISAGPKKNAVDYCLGMGAQITGDIEVDLFQEQPEDIHRDKIRSS